ncbi:MAG TPA: hypothetical protein VIR29_03130 [Anseongella sp.]
MIRVPDLFQTYTGKLIDFRNVHPEDIDIRDIAHGLAHITRFGGQAQNHITVAEHSLTVASLVPDEHKFTALMHDAAEAYLGDIPKPLKNLLPDYSRIEKYLMNIIAAKFGFEYPVHPIIKEADMEAIRREWQENVLNSRNRALIPEDIVVREEFLLKFGEYHPPW